MFYEQDHEVAHISLANYLVKEVHLHNEFEIICCISGSFEAIIDSVSYTVHKGQSVISFPNQSHYYICDNNSKFKSYNLIFSANIFEEYAKQITSCVPVNPIINHDDCPSHTKYIKKMYDSKMNPSEFDVLKRVAYCKLICAEIFENCKFVPANQSNPDVISGIIYYCNNNFTNDIHLDDLQKALHINKYYISHLFKDKFRMGFNEYIHTLRINAACKMLRKTDDTITSIASNVGYNTVRNFNRVFQKITGVTPCEYREKKEDS